MRTPLSVLLLCLLLGCQTVQPVAAPAPVSIGQHVEIWVCRCAGEEELRLGDTGQELWGEGWHYVEKLLRCSSA